MRISLNPIIKSVFGKISTKAGLSLNDYSDLDSVIQRHTIGTENGSLCSLFRIDGLKAYSLDDVYRNTLNRLAQKLGSHFKDRSHSIHHDFEIDPDNARVFSLLEQMFGPNFTTCKVIGIDADDIINAKIKKYSEYCVISNAHLALWTYPITSSSNDNEDVYLYPVDIPIGDLTAKYKKNVLLKHQSMVRRLLDIFSSVGIECDLLNVYEYVRTVRQKFNSRSTSDNYFPRLTISDGFPYPDDSGSIVPEKVSKIISPGNVYVNDFTRHTIEDKVYSNMRVKKWPFEDNTFLNLLDSASTHDLPLRYSVRISGGGQNSMEALIKHYIKWLSNSKARTSFKQLNDYVDSDGTVVSIHGNLCTWANDEDELAKNEETMIQAVQSWTCDFDTKDENPLEQFTNSIAGFKSTNKKSASFPPIHDAVKLMPFAKMSSPFKESITTLFRTFDGQIMPYSRKDPNQSRKMIGIIGEPGGGKSALINELILSGSTGPGNRSLPYIGVVDIKPSSFGALTMIQDMLPKSMKSQVVMHRLYNNKEDAINPNDTHIGARYPTESQNRFIINFWNLVCQPSNQSDNEDLIREYITDLILIVYKALDDQRDDSKPRVYISYEDEKLDDWIDNSTFTPSHDTCYWDIFDHFFEMKEYEKAIYVQRLCSPTIDDLISFSKDETLVNKYHGTKLKNNNYVYDFVERQLMHVKDRYKLLNGHTQLSFNQAKIVSIDIQPMAGNKGAEELRQTTAVYMLAKELVTRNFLFQKEDLDAIPEKYRSYHEKRLDDLKDVPKSIIYDELHMTRLRAGKATGDSQIIRDELNSMMRVVGRSESIEMILASQSAEDMDSFEALLTDVFMMRMDVKSAEKCVNTFSMDESYTHLLPSLRMPNKDGSRFVLWTKTDRNVYCHLLVLTIPAEQIWGTSTTFEDKALREHLYNIMSGIDARKLLSNYFPEGSCRELVAKMNRDRTSQLQDNVKAITDQIAEKMIAGKQLYG